MTERRRMRAAAVIAGLALSTAALLAGCAADGGPGAGPGTSAPSSSTSPEPTESGGAYPLTPVTDAAVLEYCPDISPVHLDAAPAELDDVYRCGVDPETGAQYADRLGEPDAVLAAYAVADEPLTDGACTMQFEDPAVIWLHAGGDIVAVRAPIDPCRFPQDAAVAALAATPTDRLLEVPAS